MKTYRFDCHGHSAPAYGCDQPGDNSGLYIRLEDLPKQQNEDADRYVWLLANMGMVEEEARRWNPAIDKPLLKHLQDFIDKKLASASKPWLTEQRRLLK